MAGQGKLASEVRAGLTPDAPQNSDDLKHSTTGSLLDAVWEKKTVRTHVFEFGALFGALCLIGAAYHAYRTGYDLKALYLLISGTGLICIGRFVPILLWPFWKAWMGLASLLSMVMTPLVLTVLWWIVLAPTSLVLKVLGKHVMDLSFKNGAATYWIDRDPTKDNPKLFSRMY